MLYILNSYDIVIVNDSILIGLTFSAYFMSLSDICNNVISYRLIKNELRYICYITSNALNEYISTGYDINSLSVNVNNLKRNVELLVSNYKAGIHPNEYYKNKINKILYILSNVCFIFAIVFFVLTPYFSIMVDKQISTCLTLLAFAEICFNIYLSEIIGEYIEKKNNFMNNTQIIIQTFMPDFIEFLNKRLFYYEDFVKKEEASKN